MYVQKQPFPDPSVTSSLTLQNIVNSAEADIICNKMLGSDTDIIIRLPCELACAVLTEWLRLQELVTLDTSFCNRSKRNILLEAVFSSSQFALPQFENLKLLKDFTRWIQLRSVRVSELVLTKEVDMSDCEAYLRKLGQFVKCIELENMDSLEVGCSEATCMIALYCRNLSYLSFNKCCISDSILDVLFYCSKLTQLHIECNCEELWSSNLYIANLHGLNYTNLRSTFLHCIDSQWLVEAVLMLNVPTSLVQLSVRCDGYTIALQLIQQLTRCPSLRALYLARSQCLTDSLLCEMITHCPHLYHLDLTACLDLTDTSGLAVARGVPMLRTLNMSCCAFSDAVLQELAVRCGDSLEAIHVSSCSNLTGAAINNFIQDCIHLHTVGLGGCDLYTPDLDFALLHPAITTLIVDEATLEDGLLEGIIAHGRHLQRLRLSFEEGYEEFDFAQLNATQLPALHTLVSINPYEGAAHNTPSISALVEARPTLRVTHDAHVLLYHLFDQPL